VGNQDGCRWGVNSLVNWGLDGRWWGGDGAGGCDTKGKQACFETRLIFLIEVR